MPPWDHDTFPNIDEGGEYVLYVRWHLPGSDGIAQVGIHYIVAVLQEVLHDFGGCAGEWDLEKTLPEMGMLNASKPDVWWQRWRRYADQDECYVDPAYERSHGADPVAAEVQLADEIEEGINALRECRGPSADSPWRGSPRYLSQAKQMPQVFFDMIDASEFEVFREINPYA